MISKYERRVIPPLRSERLFASYIFFPQICVYIRSRTIERRRAAVDRLLKSPEMLGLEA